nr:unnamed protein product [Timema poppensis]
MSTIPLQSSNECNKSSNTCWMVDPRIGPTRRGIAEKQVFINPEMKVLNYEKLVFPEGCESVRGFAADVPRYKEVTVPNNEIAAKATLDHDYDACLVPVSNQLGLNERGEAVSLQVAGWPARIVQHEMDHLIGRLYTDSMMRSSLACTAWHQVNASGGKLHIPYTPKKRN